MSWLDIDLGSGIIEALRALRRRNRDWRAVVEETRRFLEDGATDDETKAVEKALTDAGLGDRLVRVREFWAELSDRNRALLAPVAALDTEQAWPIFDPSVDIASFALPAGSVSFKAEANLAAEIETMSGESLAVLGLEPPPEEALLRIGLDGSLRADSSAALRYGFVAGRGAATASATAELDYYYSVPRTELLIEALADALPGLPSPFDGRDMLDRRTRGLDAVAFKVSGTADLSAGIELGRVLKGRGAIGPADTEIGVDGSVTAGFDATLRYEGEFDVLARPLEGSLLRIRLTRRSSRGRSASVNLKANVEITGLDELGNRLCRDLVPDAAELIDELEPYLDLEAVLRERLAEDLDLGDLEQPLIDLVSGREGGKDGLVTAIQDALGSAARDKLDTLVADPDDTGRDLATRVADRLSLEDDVRQALITRLGAALSTKLSDVRGELESKVASWLAGSKPKLRRLVGPLEVVGANARTLVRTSQDRADAVLKPVLAFLDRYQQIRRKLTRGIEGAARVKIGLAFSKTWSVSRSRGALVEATLDVAKPGIADLYRELLVGKFDSLMRLADLADSGVEIHDGELRNRIARGSRLDLSVSVGALEFGVERVMSSTVMAAHDLAGNVLLASGMGEFRNVVKAFKEQRSIEFVNSFELAGVGDPTGPDKLIAAGLRISLRDDRLVRDELEEFFGSLEGAGLIAGGATARIAARYDALGAKAERKFQKAQLGVSMPLDSRSIRRLLGQADDRIRIEAIVKQVNLFFSGPDSIRFRRHIDAWPGPDLVTRIRTISATRPHLAAKEHPFGGSDAQNTNPQLLADLVHADEIGERAERLVELVRSLRIAADVDPTTLDADGTKRLLDRVNTDVHECVREWLEVTGVLRGFFTERVPAPTLAFMVTIGALARMGLDDAPLVPIIQWNFGDPDQEEELVV